MRTVTLYGRPECHLCDLAREMLERIQVSGTEFRLEVVDIEADDRLLSRYLERIPVVTCDGQVISELVPKERTLRATLDTVGT